MKGERQTMAKVRNTTRRMRIFGRRFTATALSVLTVLSVFASLNLGFGWMGLTAHAADSQTRYHDINEFQKAEFSRIQNRIFSYANGSKINPENSQSYKTPSELFTGGMQVTEGNEYFNWTDTDEGVAAGTISRWDSGSDYYYPHYTSSGNYFYADRTKSIAGNTFSVYDVESADDFYAAMRQTANQATAPNGARSSYMVINITKDIDMDGKNTSFNPFTPNSSSNFYLYIEGNGHTIYNLRIQGYQSNGAALMAAAPRYFVCRNLGFRSTMVLNTSTTSGSTGAALLVCKTNRKFLIENVHSQIAYMQTDPSDSSGMGGIIGRTNSLANYGDRFIKNCSTTGHIMFGGMHVGGMTSFASAYVTNNNYRQRYDVDYPADAASYVLAKGNATVSRYPLMIFNSSSTDCTIFSLGADSGSFISCGCGLRVKNCYSNNTIYAKNNTGGFIGRSADINMSSESNVSLKDAAGTATVTSHFENCYSCGVVEGTVSMGGFVGLLNGRRSAEGDNSELAVTGNTNKLAATVFTNCFSTAMVGMDYAGKYCGGFAGLDDNYVSRATAVKINGANRSSRGTWYINCYSAGEVGNILTVTDRTAAANYESEFFGDSVGDSNDRSNQKDGSTIYDYYPTGGFIGAINLDRYRFHVHGESATGIGNWFGSFVNCYYDMQTSAMREMAVGLKAVGNNDTGDNIPGNFQLPGITGVYTEKSDVKHVPGLTDFGQPQSEVGKDTPNPVESHYMDSYGSDGDAWTYTDEYYPQLKPFMVADLTVPLSEVTEEVLQELSGTRSDPAASVFYIPNSPASSMSLLNSSAVTTATVSSFYKPVLSLGQVIKNVDGVPVYHEMGDSADAAVQFAGVAQAYRYCQAATATVLLDHWDSIMSLQIGEGGSDWQAADPNRELAESQHGEATETVNDEEYNVYYIDYSGIRAGTYEFKIKAGTTQFEYGLNHLLDANNMSLRVNKDNSNIRIKFYYKKGILSSLTDEQLKTNEEFLVKVENRDVDNINRMTADELGALPDSVKILTDNSGNRCAAYYIHEYKNDEVQETPALGYYLPGSFDGVDSVHSNWNNGPNPAPKFVYAGTNALGSNIYKVVLKNLKVSESPNGDGRFEFKVTKAELQNGTENLYATWYGDTGADGGNMSFTISEDSDVTVIHDEGRHYTYVFGDKVTARVDSYMASNGSPQSSTKPNVAVALKGASWNWDVADFRNYPLTYTGVNLLGERLFQITVPSSYEGSPNQDWIYNENKSVVERWANDAKGTYVFKYGVTQDPYGTPKSDWAGGMNGVDNMFYYVAPESGERNVVITYNLDRKSTTVENADAYYVDSNPYNPASDAQRYRLRGSFDDGWAESDNRWMAYDADSAGVSPVFTYTFDDLTPNTEYQFKVTRVEGSDTKWYGDQQADNGDNMTFTTNADPQSVTVRFYTSTGYTTVEGDITASYTGSISGATVKDEENIDLRLVNQYSVIGKQTIINHGWDWKDKNGTADIVSACVDGLMTPQSDGTYTYTFTLDEKADRDIKAVTKKLYAYKIVFEGNEKYNTGGNRNFTIIAPDDDDDYSFAGKSITIHYDPNGANDRKTWFTADDTTLERSIIPYADSLSSISYYATGTKELFGLPEDFYTGQDLGIKTKFDYQPNLGLYTLNLFSTIWSDDEHTVTQLPAKKYEFKITYGIGWDSGIDFGDPGTESGNYVLDLKQPATSVTIYFNPKSKASCKIYCKAEPEGAIVYNDYYLAGDKNFTKFIPGFDESYSGTGWEFENHGEAVMPHSFENNDARIWVSNVKPNDIFNEDEFLALPIDGELPVYSYAIKVGLADGQSGIDPSGEGNYVFRIKPDDSFEGSDERYRLLITYDESTGETNVDRINVRVYPQNEDSAALMNPNNTLSEEALDALEEEADRLTAELFEAPPETSFWAAIGAAGFTNDYNWSFGLKSARDGYMTNNTNLLGFQTLSQKNAAGEMETLDLTKGNIYVMRNPIRVRFEDSTKAVQTAEFKVFADGSNAVGYPNTNMTVTLKPPTDTAPLSCDLRIAFDASTKQIYSFATNSDMAEPLSYLDKLDENMLTWYIYGESTLYNYSFGSSSAETTVYDTVRDITADFCFTAGLGSEQRGIAIDKDMTSGRNFTDQFNSEISFDMNYETTDNINGSKRTNKVNGKFNAPVINLKVSADFDEQTGDQVRSSDYIPRFSVDQFAPGKQWLSVRAVGYGLDVDYKSWKQQYADYNVYKSEYDTFSKYVNIYLQRFAEVQYNGSLVDTEEKLIDYLRFYRRESEVDYESLVSYLEDYDILAHYDGVEGEGAKAKIINGVSYIIPGISVMRSLGWDNKYMTINGTRVALEDAVHLITTASSIVGSRDIRLIPTTYLEAGVDMNVNVVQKESSNAQQEAQNAAEASNSVTFDYVKTLDGENKDPYEFTGSVVDSDGEVKNFGTNIDLIAYQYFNVALTSAYVVSDKVGLGVYENYQANEIQPYSAELIRDDNDSAVRDKGQGHRYFAMSSAYPQGAEYKDNGSRTSAMLAVDRFDNMSMIGPTYNDLNSNPVKRTEDGSIDASDIEEGKTYLDENGSAYIFVNAQKFDAAGRPVTDGNGNNVYELQACPFKLDSDGKYKYQNAAGEWLEYNYGTRVYYEPATTRILIYKAHYEDGRLVRDTIVPTQYSTPEDTENTTRKQNYRKWTGAQNFTERDNGTYEVLFTWRLEDGRYVEDSKVVTIGTIRPGIRKSVDISYDGEGSNELTYTVTYTNMESALMIDFALLDVLPFNLDARKEAEGSTRGYNGYTHSSYSGDGAKFRLKSFTIDENNRTDIKEVYYTSRTDPQSWIYYSDYETYIDDEGKHSHAEEHSVFVTDAQGHQLYRYSDGGSERRVYTSTRTVLVHDDETNTDNYRSEIYLQDADDPSRQYAMPSAGLSNTDRIQEQKLFPIMRPDTELSDRIEFAVNSSTGYDTGKIKDNESIWTAVNRPNKDSLGYGTGYYKMDSAPEVTAMLVSGIQLACGQNITISYTLEYEGKAGDFFSNNAYYLVKPSDEKSGAIKVTGASDPVTTAIVDRSLSGYAWLDNVSKDGIVQANEPKLKYVKVALYQKVTGADEYSPTGKTTMTDATGRYTFDHLPGGVYQVRFLDPDPDPETGARRYIKIVTDGGENLSDETLKNVEMRDLISTLYHTKASNYDSHTDTYIIDPDEAVMTHNLATLRTGIDNDRQTFTYTAINNILAPANQEIYLSYNSQGDSYSLNTDLSNYKWNVVNMNAGFTYNSKYFYSIDVNKVTQNDKPLDGVKFKLEWYYDGSNVDEYPSASGGWYPVYNVIDINSEIHMGEEPLTEEQLAQKREELAAEIEQEKAEYKRMNENQEARDGTSLAGNPKAMALALEQQQQLISQLEDQLGYFDPIATTMQGGIIGYTGLLPGRYRLTETETVDGYLPYKESIEIDLPYEIASSRTISGVAWNDLNGDGKRTEDEALYTNQTLVLYKLGDDGEYAATTLTANTDSETAAYRFENVPAGIYKIYRRDAGVTYELTKGRITVSVAALEGTADANTTLYLFMKNSKGEFVDTGKSVNTGSDGKYSFTQLQTGTYKIAEKTGGTAQFITDEQVVNVPLTKNADFEIQNSVGSNRAYVIASNEDVTSYNHVTFKVINNRQQFDVPESGGTNDDLMQRLIVGMAMFLLGALAFILVFLRRERLRKPAARGKRRGN